MRSKNHHLRVFSFLPKQIILLFVMNLPNLTSTYNQVSNNSLENIS